MVDFVRPTKIRDVRVDGEGTTEVYYPTYGSYGYQGDECLEFTIEELEDILAEAKAHKAAYDAYKAADYEESAYDAAYVDPKGT